MKRQIKLPLLWAKRYKMRKRPPIKFANEAMAAGVRYEKKFFAYMKDKYGAGVEVHPWIDFEDANGWGLCQVDLLMKEPPIIFECKISFTPRKAYKEMQTLYQPVVEMYMGARAKMVQVCQHLKPSAKRTTVVKSFKEVQESEEEQLTWLWRPQ